MQAQQNMALRPLDEAEQALMATGKDDWLAAGFGALPNFSLRGLGDIGVPRLGMPTLPDIKIDLPVVTMPDLKMPGHPTLFATTKCTPMPTTKLPLRSCVGSSLTRQTMGIACEEMLSLPASLDVSFSLSACMLRLCCMSSGARGKSPPTCADGSSPRVLHRDFPCSSSESSDVSRFCV